VLRADSDVEIETAPLVATPEGPLWLCLDCQPVCSTDLWLFHKTTDRRRYDERARRHPNADDVVLVNQRGEVTETARANLALCLDGHWSTPPLGSGLLPGVERARSLAEGRLVERVLSVEDLRRADRVATLSSLRGWRAARVRPLCNCLAP
jgi:para-aminobenzoate synthetase / 4-amino-4-deoxychorismate lyase